jgi:hypothetical protein
MSSSSSTPLLEAVDFFLDGACFILPPPLAKSPGLVEFGDPGEAKLDEPIERGEKTGFT